MKLANGMNPRALFEAGRDARRREDLAQAASCFEAFLQLVHDDAAAHLELGMARLAQRRRDEAVDSFILAAHFAPREPEPREALVDALLSSGRAEEARSELVALAEMFPGRAQVHFLQGRYDKHQGDLLRARRAFERATDCAPQEALFWSQLGHTEYLLGEYVASRAHLERARALAPALPEPQHNLGLLALELGHPNEALEQFCRADRAQPGTPAILSAKGHALRDLGRYADALAAYAAALDLDAEYGDALLNRCLTRLRAGDYARGWEEYEQRFIATSTAVGGTGAPRWQGEPLRGRNLLIIGEQGLGDEIMFASCLPDALRQADGDVTVTCDPRLVGLFTRSLPAARFIGVARGAGATAPRFPPADFEIPIGSLPRLFRRRSEDFAATSAFLQADPDRVAYWRGRLAARREGPWLGLAWRGGTLRTRSVQRSMTLEDWKPLFALDVGIVSLQHGDTGAELAAAQSGPTQRLFSMPEALRDPGETAALIMATQGVVTVDNTVAHLAGGLGAHAQVLLSRYPEWRYPRSGRHCVWYPSLRAVHQSMTDGWNGAVVEACTEIRSSLVL